jgi:hypothetical protein
VWCNLNPDNPSDLKKIEIVFKHLEWGWKIEVREDPGPQWVGFLIDGAHGYCPVGTTFSPPVLTKLCINAIIVINSSMTSMSSRLCCWRASSSHPLNRKRLAKGSSPRRWCELYCGQRSPKKLNWDSSVPSPLTAILKYLGSTVIPWAPGEPAPGEPFVGLTSISIWRLMN